MHRRAAIAVLAAAVLVPGLQAQMKSAGRGGSPFRGSTSMGAVAGSGHAAMPASRHFGTAPGFHSGGWSGGGGWSGNRRFHHFVHKGFINSNGCYYGYCGGGYAGYIAPPIFWSGSDYAAGYDSAGYAATQYVPATPAYDDSALRMQIQQLTDQVEQMREEQAHIRAQQTPASARPSRMDLPTILVFRDGRVSEVSNYGIAGKTLWIFDGQFAKKVPLGELDLAATQGANDDRGGFVVPQ